MVEWWQSLSLDNQWFFGAAAFFSVLFLWQFIASLTGLGDHGSMDVSAHMDVDVGASPHDVTDAAAGFHYISVRSVLAFLTLFSWAAALYRASNTSMEWTLLLAMIWGLVGMTVVTIVVNQLRKLQEVGNIRMRNCVGARGTVYLDIPAGGQGEVRVQISGVVSVVKARSADGEPIKAGTEVHVCRLLDETTVEVAV